MAVRHAWGLAAAKPVDYASSPFGRFDPVLLSQLRKRIATVKETWSALSGGDGHKLKSVRDQFASVGDTLVTLYPASQPLAQAMNAANAATARPGPLKDFYDAMVERGMHEELARVTLARKLAAVVLRLWKKAEPYDATKLTVQAA